MRFRVLILSAFILAGLVAPAPAHHTPPVPGHDVWNPGGCGVYWMAVGNYAGQTTIQNHRFNYWRGAAYPIYYNEGLIRERWAQAGYECGSMGKLTSNPAVASNYNGGDPYIVVYQSYVGGCISYRHYQNDGFILGPVLYCLT